MRHRRSAVSDRRVRGEKEGSSGGGSAQQQAWSCCYDAASLHETSRLQQQQQQLLHKQQQQHHRPGLVLVLQSAAADLHCLRQAGTFHQQLAVLPMKGLRCALALGLLLWSSFATVAIVQGASPSFSLFSFPSNGGSVCSCRALVPARLACAVCARMLLVL